VRIHPHRLLHLMTNLAKRVMQRLKSRLHLKTRAAKNVTKTVGRARTAMKHNRPVRTHLHLKSLRHKKLARHVQPLRLRRMRRSHRRHVKIES